MSSFKYQIYSIFHKEPNSKFKIGALFTTKFSVFRIQTQKYEDYTFYTKHIIVKSIHYTFVARLSI